MAADALKVDMQWDSFTEVSQLPQDLTRDDVGKAWWISNQVYVWDGQDYRIRSLGIDPDRR